MGEVGEIEAGGMTIEPSYVDDVYFVPGGGGDADRPTRFPSVPPLTTASPASAASPAPATEGPTSSSRPTMRSRTPASEGPTSSSRPTMRSRTPATGGTPSQTLATDGRSRDHPRTRDLWIKRDLEVKGVGDLTILRARRQPQGRGQLEITLDLEDYLEGDFEVKGDLKGAGDLEITLDLEI
jgi:hypothetical protein